MHKRAIYCRPLEEHLVLVSHRKFIVDFLAVYFNSHISTLSDIVSPPRSCQKTNYTQNRGGKIQHNRGVKQCRSSDNDCTKTRDVKGITRKTTSISVQCSLYNCSTYYSRMHPCMSSRKTRICSHTRTTDKTIRNETGHHERTMSHYFLLLVLLHIRSPSIENTWIQSRRPAAKRYADIRIYTRARIPTNIHIDTCLLEKQTQKQQMCFVMQAQTRPKSA